MEGRSEGLYKMEGLYRKMSGVRELLEKEDKGLLLARISSFWGEGKARDSCRLPLGDGVSPRDR